MSLGISRTPFVLSNPKLVHSLNAECAGDKHLLQVPKNRISYLATANPLPARQLNRPAHWLRNWRHPMTHPVTRELLKSFLDAFNRHDLDAIMDCFADDCVFYMPRGAGPRGDRYAGKDEVRAGLAKRFEGIPDVHYADDQHWVGENFGVSEWTLTGTSVTGQKIEVRGCDLLEFDQGKITRKDAFWKILSE